MTIDKSTSLWERLERPAPAPRQVLSPQRIATAAVAIADAEGLDAVSIRRVAAELGAGTTSLSRYVSKKDEILELMGDEVLDELRDTELPAGWREALRTIARALREVCLRHPWFANVLAGRAIHGPHSLHWRERTLSAFDGMDLGTDEMLAALGTLSAFVLGHVLGELADREAARRSGLSHDQWMEREGEYGPMIMASGEYPRFTRVMVEAELPHAADRQERGFEAGLDRVLAGIAAHLPA